MTSLFYHDGKMFFTRSGQSTLYRRGFEPESDIVGQQRFSTPQRLRHQLLPTMRGAFVANNQFYYADTTGRLFRAAWSGNSPVRRHVGPGLRSRHRRPDLELPRDVRLPGRRPADRHPADRRRRHRVHGPDLLLRLDRLQRPGGGGIASVLWQFGDTVDTTSTSPQATHTYAAPARGS